MKPAIPRTLPLDSLDWTGLMPAAGQANRALARYDGMLAHLPSPQLLRTPLLTREAVLSSRIEGTQATVGEVLRFEAGQSPTVEFKKLDIEEIVDYRHALQAARRELKSRPFSLNLVLNLHRILLSSVRGHNKAPGEFRRVQNCFGRPGAPIHQATFVPPSPELLLKGLYNWETYYHSEDKDVLVQLALLHAQFEFLHPFLDGNGRIGRILIPIFLFGRKVLTSPSFYLSEFLEEHRDEYIDHLASLTDGVAGWNRWCQFFLRGITIQAEWNTHRVQAILALHDRLRDRLLEITSSRSVLPLLDALFAQPVFQASALLKVPGMPKRAQLLVLLDRLVQQGILKVVTAGSGRRGTVYSLHQLVKLCESRPRLLRSGRSTRERVEPTGP